VGRRRAASRRDGKALALSGNWALLEVAGIAHWSRRRLYGGPVGGGAQYPNFIPWGAIRGMWYDSAKAATAGVK